ncbi:MAG: SPOR domain-containing protein [Gammaproteobacteria bacterium]|nr:SPOR domain-containing protein [Gammaproteobacteria bacterium]
MTEVFKNRLIGSAILIVAAIVFLPDLLDGQKHVVKDDFKAVPERPEFAAVAQQQVFAQDQHDASRQQAMTLPVDDSPALDDETIIGPSTDPQPGTSGETTPVTETLPDQTYASVDTDSAAAKPVRENQGASAASTIKVAEVPVVAVPAVSQNNALNQAGWMVKVGSFGKEQNANALISKLRQAGFATFSRKISNSQGRTMVSVLVGPDLKKEQLERSLPQLQELAGVKNLKVTSFTPVENN